MSEFSSNRFVDCDIIFGGSHTIQKEEIKMSENLISPFLAHILSYFKRLLFSKFPDSPFGDVKLHIKREPVEADDRVIELTFRVKLPDSAVDRERVKRHILENGVLVLRRIDHP